MKKTLKNITENSVNKWQCEFCNKNLSTERALLKHKCVIAERWSDRDSIVSKMAYNFWHTFYNETQPSAKKTVNDFIRSQYYGAFWRFADYCRAVKVIDTDSYFRYLLKNKIPIDNWAKDSVYSKFIAIYLPAENPLDSVYRSVEHIIELSKETQYKPSDYLRWSGSNRICQSIVNGRVTGWFLYNCDSGIHFINNLNESQLDMVWDLIEPNSWLARFKLKSDDQKIVKEILTQGGF